MIKKPGAPKTSDDYTDEQAETLSDLTPKRERLIKKLEQVCAELAKEGCWLYSTGTMAVMAYGDDGNAVIHSNVGGSIDSRFILYSIDTIVSEGGDW